MSTLYEITDEYLSILPLLDDPDIPAEAIEDALEQIRTSLGDKIDNCVAMIDEWKSTEKVLQDEIDRLRGRKTMFGNRRERLRAYLKSNLKKFNKPRLETERHTVQVRKGGPVVKTNDHLPDEWYRVVREPDKARIKTALLAGEEISGAWLETGSETLMIR